MSYRYSNLFTSIEDYVVKKMRDAMHIMHRLQSTVTMSYFWHMGKFFVDRARVPADVSCGLPADGGGGSGARVLSS